MSGIPATVVAAAPVSAEETKKEIANVSEFKTHLKEIVDSFTSYDSLHEKVLSLKTGQALVVNGVTVDKAALRSMKSDICTSIKDLHKYFRASKAKKAKSDDPNAPKSARVSGFDNPIYVSQHVVDFYLKNQASLGLDPKTGRAFEQLLLSLKTKRLTTSRILTCLWTIYYSYTQNSQISVHTTELDAKTGKPKEVKYLRADTNMRTCFGPAGSNTFNHLTTRPPKISAKTNKPTQAFNPERFAYTAWQMILSHNRLTPEGAGAFNLPADLQNNLRSMNEWNKLSRKDQTKLTEEEKIIIQSVQSKSFHPQTTPEQRTRITAYVAAKQDLDQLELEKKVAVEALGVLKGPDTGKKGKKTASNGVAIANGSPLKSVPFSGSSVPVPNMVPLMK